MKAAKIETDSGFRIADRVTLFDDSRYALSIYYATYDVHPLSGDLLMGLTGSEVSQEVVVVVNWFEELTARVPN